MKTVQYRDIVEKVAQACIEANYRINSDLENAYKEGIDKENHNTQKEIMTDLYKNACIAREESIPICQDTGTAVVFVDLGQEVHIEGGFLYEAINEGVFQGYKEGFLRKSIVSHPFERDNTGTNTPAVIHTQIHPGDMFNITVAPKGGGSENMSRLQMLPPSAGKSGFLDFVVDSVKKAGANPCPPIVVGACAGGNFETCALEAKKALLRPLNSHSKNDEIAGMEKDLLEKINSLGIGPQGFGGNTTAFAVHVALLPCHLASMPVAVNINCHVARHVTFGL